MYVHEAGRQNLREPFEAAAANRRGRTGQISFPADACGGILMNIVRSGGSKPPPYGIGGRPSLAALSEAVQLYDGATPSLAALSEAVQLYGGARPS